MNLLLDGLLVLSNHWLIVVGVLLTLLLGYGTVSSVLKAILEDNLTAAEYFSLSIGGCLLPVSLGTLFIFSQGVFHRNGMSIFIVLTIMFLSAILLHEQMKKTTARGPKLPLLALILIFFVSIFFRLTFVSKVIVPLYFDSAEHYRIIQNLLEVYKSSQSIFQISWPVPRYYHLGFHLLAAVLVSAVQGDVKDTILILGQIILAIIPLPIFFIVRHETKSDNAGLLAVLLASFGWYMPAYAVNWGKYPALTSLVVIQFVFSIAYIASQYRKGSSKQWGLFAILGLGIFIAGLIHTRSVVIIGMAFASWMAAKWWCNSPKLIRFLILFLILSVILIEVIFIQSLDVLKVVFDPYIRNGFLITSIILLLSPFAFRSFPHLALSSALAILFLLSSLFIPVVRLIPGYGYLTLLDRPFVEMVLYFPLSILGGLEYTGLEQCLLDIQQKRRNSYKGVHILANTSLLGIMLLHVFVNYNFYPSDCCKIVSYDDLVSFDWIDKNLPLDARILVSTTELRVLASNESEGYVGADAGVWIPSLANRQTFGLPNTLNFGQQSTIDMLCKHEITSIYVGGTKQSFDDSQLSTHPDWYQIVLFLPKAQVYKIIGCVPSHSLKGGVVRTSALPTLASWARVRVTTAAR